MTSLLVCVCVCVHACTRAYDLYYIYYEGDLFIHIHMHVFVCILLPEVLYVFLVTVGLVNVRTYIA